MIAGITKKTTFANLRFFLFLVKIVQLAQIPPHKGFPPPCLLKMWKTRLCAVTMGELGVET